MNQPMSGHHVRRRPRGRGDDEGGAGELTKNVTSVLRGHRGHFRMRPMRLDESRVKNTGWKMEKPVVFRSA